MIDKCGTSAKKELVSHLEQKPLDRIARPARDGEM